MATRSYPTELSAYNLAAVRGLSPDVAATVDPNLWRGSRVLVPVSLQALVVTAQNAAGPWADVAVRRDAQNQLLAPPPFTDQAPRPVGVHLHWALPDALSRGKVAKGGTGDPAFPLVPDRWLVVRMAWNADRSRRVVTAWVIESEQPDPAKRVTPLSSWKETRLTNPVVRELTAVGPKKTSFSPVYTAIYDNVRGTLAFHDPLTSVTSDTLTYMVAGWFSTPTDDPLFSGRTEHTWLERMQALRWSLTGDDVLRAQTAAQWLHLKHSETGLGYKPENFVAVEKFASEISPMMSPNLGGTIYRADTPLMDASGLTVAESFFSLYGPRQTLCHGLIYDVPWEPAAKPPSGAPKPTEFSLCAGNTGAEALSCELSKAKYIAESNVYAFLDKLDEADDRERMFSAFHYGLLPLVSSPDGLASLDQYLHDQTFSSSPGGSVTDTIEQDDMSGEPARAALTKTPAAGQTRLTLDATFIRPGKGMHELAYDIRPGAAPQLEQIFQVPAKSSTERPRKMVQVERTLPRFFQPAEPALLMVPARRSFRFGEDGRFAEDGSLVCRLSGETIRTLAPVVRHGQNDDDLRIPVSGGEIRLGDLDSGQIPEEAMALLDETLLLDETNAAALSAKLIAANTAYLKQTHGFTDAQITSLKSTLPKSIATEQTFLLNPLVNPEADVPVMLGLSGLAGTFPSKVALERWTPPWTPIYLEWEATYHAIPAISDWKLGEIEYAVKVAAPPTPTATYNGRTILTPHLARTFKESLERYLADREAARPEDEGPDEVEDVLGDALSRWGDLDVSSATLDGLHDLLRGATKVRYFNPANPAQPIDPAAGKPVLGLRGGVLRFTRLRVVDLFGQTVQLAGAQIPEMARPESMRSTDINERGLVLPPRILQSSQLALRLLAADAPDDRTEATKQVGPVCGFLVPDHLDGALEVYDSVGKSQGQLQTALSGRGIEWQGTPGLPGSWGKPPALKNRHLRGLVEGLLAWGPKDAQADRDENQSALAAILRTIDAALWTVDPMGRLGSEHLSVLVGRPLAVVRARVRIGTAAPVVAPDLARALLPVRLGLLTRLHDGLMGYFVDDDYSRFYPVHEVLAKQTRAGGRHEGFHAAAHAVSGFYDAFPAKPVDHPYLDASPTLRLRIGQTARLTLLLDPRGGVHATSGVLPTKKIELMREHVSKALDAIALTFRVGPVLSDPTTIRMPLPKEIRGQWSWVRRTGVTVWNEAPVVHASQDAMISKTPSELMEGWLRLTKAFAGQEP